MEIFDDCFGSLGKSFKRCYDKHLTLNWTKFHFMLKREYVFLPVISHERIEVDKAEVDLIANFLLFM